MRRPKLKKLYKKLGDDYYDKLRKRIRGHQFKEGYYRVKFQQPPKLFTIKGTPVYAPGTCDAPSVKNRTIHISPKCGEYDLLRVAIDESIHASCWALDNGQVEEMSNSISEFLWRLGFRVDVESV